MFRKKKNRTKRSLSCVQVAGGMREVGRAADGTMIWTRGEKEREREILEEGGGEKKESEKGGLPRGGSCAGASVNEVVG